MHPPRLRCEIRHRQMAIRLSVPWSDLRRPRHSGARSPQRTARRPSSSNHAGGRTRGGGMSFEERIGLRAAWDSILRRLSRPLPPRSLGVTLGSVAVFLFLVQALSGALLAVY